MKIGMNNGIAKATNSTVALPVSDLKALKSLEITFINLLFTTTCFHFHVTSLATLHTSVLRIHFAS
jgi:hypothetical protein